MADSRVELVADFDAFTLNGVGFGESVEGLPFLGPGPTDSHAFPGQGLSVDVTENKLDGFLVALGAKAFISGCKPGDVQPFVGTIRMGGRAWYPRELTHERHFTEVFGEPYWRDVDDEEVLLFFEFARGELQVEVSLDDRVQVLVASQAPLLADPEQRHAYGVTRPWPPT